MVGPARPRPYGYSSFEHASNRRSPLSVSCSVAIDKAFALERHPVLHSDPAIECLHAIEILIGDGFAVIKEPVQAVEGDLAIHLFKDSQSARDCLVVRSEERRVGKECRSRWSPYH